MLNLTRMAPTPASEGHALARLLTRAMPESSAGVGCPRSLSLLALQSHPPANPLK